MSGPEPDAEKLSAALNQEGLLLEAEAFFTSRRREWDAVHGFRYGDPPDSREIDVLASKSVEFDVKAGTRRVTGRVFVPIECKHATQWWVFVDLSHAKPDSNEFIFYDERSPIAQRLMTLVMQNVVNDSKGPDLPNRAWSTKEMAFNYQKVKREQYYGAFRQAQSAMRGIMQKWPKGGLSTTQPFLGLAVPVVMTSQRLVVARAKEGDDEFTFEETDWVISGPPPTEMIHVVTASGLERLLDLLDRVTTLLTSRKAQRAIETLLQGGKVVEPQQNS